MSRVSLADIARQAGCAVSTVSKALRHSREIPPATRRRIQQAARRLDYRPNPLLASLASRNFSPRKNDGTPLAYLCLAPPALPPDRVSSSAAREPARVWQTITQALREHAGKLGYRLEIFPVGLFRDGAHAAHILFSRGFHGIILPPDFRYDILAGMDWNLFSVVAWGQRPAEISIAPELSRATVDHFRLVVQAWEETWKRGYRRIAFVFFSEPGAQADDQLRWGAAELCRRRARPRDRLPINDLSHDHGVFDFRALAQWVRQRRPDAVIGFNGLVRWALRHENFRVPEDFGFVSLHREMGSDLLRRPDETESGMKNMQLECMVAALELLDQQIRRHQYGLPRHPYTLTIRSTWMDGDSLPPR